MKKKPLEPIEPKGVGSNIPLPLNIRVTNLTNLKSAKRLMSKLISSFISGKISNQNAKDLAYLVSTYVSIAKDSEIEGRIKMLEEKLK